MAGPLPLRERGGLDAAGAADAAVAATEDDVDAPAGVPRAAAVSRAAAVPRAAGVPRAVGGRAVAAEEVGASANAEEENSEPDLALTGFRQSVDQKKKNRDRGHQGSVRAVFFRCDSWNPLRSYYNARGTPNTGGSTSAQTQGGPNPGRNRNVTAKRKSNYLKLPHVRHHPHTGSPQRTGAGVSNPCTNEDAGRGEGDGWDDGDGGGEEDGRDVGEGRGGRR